jgi:hypothetical protein
VVEHERDLHHINLLRPVEHIAERKDAHQRRCLVPQAAGPLAPLGDHFQPLHRFAVPHDPILGRSESHVGPFQ